MIPTGPRSTQPPTDDGLDSPGASRCSTRRAAAVVLLALATLTGCYHYRVEPVDAPPGTEPESTTQHSLFWGLVQTQAEEPNCQGNGAAEVVATTNLGFSLLTVATLGIWSPLQLEWRCAKDRIQPVTGME